MEVNKSKVFVGDVSHEKHVIIPEGIEIVDNNCVITYQYELFERTRFGSSVRVIELPHSLKESIGDDSIIKYNRENIIVIPVDIFK